MYLSVPQEAPITFPQYLPFGLYLRLYLRTRRHLDKQHSSILRYADVWGWMCRCMRVGPTQRTGAPEVAQNDTNNGE